MDTNQRVQQTMGGAMATRIRAASREKEIPDMATLHERIRTKKVSPVEVVNTCLKRIERINPDLKTL
jgi:hypothetical protein